jgi:hypothetical protein
MKQDLSACVGSRMNLLTVSIVSDYVPEKCIKSIPQNFPDILLDDLLQNIKLMHKVIYYYDLLRLINLLSANIILKFFIANDVMFPIVFLTFVFYNISM